MTTLQSKLIAGEEWRLQSKKHLACVLFSDLKGFTALTEKLGASTIVRVMHELWSCFDELVLKHGMYKVCLLIFIYVCVYVYE
jgi:class 3 adenylate cyclase